jgi:hypothetical protein
MKPVTLTSIEHQALTMLKKHKRVTVGMLKEAHQKQELPKKVDLAAFGRLVKKGLAKDCSSGGFAWILIGEAAA